VTEATVDPRCIEQTALPLKGERHRAAALLESQPGEVRGNQTSTCTTCEQRITRFWIEPEEGRAGRWSHWTIK